jgi:hypothetical protein
MFIEDRYDFNIDETVSIFEFFSEGKNGKVKKVIYFNQTEIRGLYNLGFGDFDEITGEIDDLIVTDNGDSEKVLVTVASSIYIFTENNPNAFVFLVGSTPARTRLYRMGITKYFDKISNEFVIKGLQNNSWIPFEHNGKFIAFLVKRKSKTI